MRNPLYIFVSLLFSLCANPLLAQRPQGSSQHYTDVLAFGTGVLALSDDGKILQSTDAGETYTELHSVTSPDELYGLGANGQIVMAAGKDGSLLRADFSVDTAVWTETNPAGIFGDLLALDANGVNDWVAVGDEVLRSTDNGLTWGNVSPASLDVLNDVVFTGTANTWVAVGGSFTAEAYYSTDGGATWSVSTLPAAFIPLLHAVAVDDAGNVLAVGENGTVLLSTNQGQSFTSLASVNVSQDLNGVDSNATGQWIIGGTQRLLLSVDSTLDSSSTLLAPVTESGFDTGNDVAIVDTAVIMAGVQEVAAPQITSPATSSLSPIEVTIVPGAGTDNTFYSLDANGPDAGSTAYTTPFTIDESLTVSAVSQRDGVYSAVASQAYNITIHTLSITSVGADINLTLDTSLVGYSYQLISNTDLTDAGGWIDVGSPVSGTGNPLPWTILNPTGVLCWRVEISALP